MATKVTVPHLGESVVEATVGKWLVGEGDYVDKDQPVVELMTDKADSEVPAPAAGVITRVLKSEDETVTAGEPLCELDETAQARPAASTGDGKGAAEASDQGASPQPSAEARPQGAPAGNGAEAPAGGESDQPSSPSVRKLAREMSVELQKVTGTGKGGRVTRDDVMRAAEEQQESAAPSKMPEEEAAALEVSGARQPAESRPSAAEAKRRPAKEGPAGPPSQPQQPGSPQPTGPKGAFRLPPYVPKEGDEVIPFSRRRRIIADHMVYSKQTAPDVVTFAECDLHETSKVRDAHKAEAKRTGTRLSFLAFTAAAACRALREYPDLNARVLDDAYVRLRDINLGIAVDTEEGLVVPVVPHADELTVKGLSRAVDDLGKRARDGKLSPDDLADKTFALSNPGRRGNLVGGAIISQPNVGILRMGSIKKRVVVVERDGEDLMAIHPVMQLALTYDHRVIDGAVANGFLYRVAEILEEGEFEL